MGYAAMFVLVSASLPDILFPVRMAHERQGTPEQKVVSYTYRLANGAFRHGHG